MLDSHRYDGRTALVLGASRALGGAVAAALAWPGRFGAIAWVAGDVMDRGDVVVAARGADVIVHAVDPAKCRDRDVAALWAIDNAIVAARLAGGARILLPATIHSFDPATTPVVRDRSPQQPRSRRGELLVEVEDRLWDARDDAPSLIVRSGEPFGPHLRLGWFAQAMVRPGRPVERITNPGRGVGHAWAYLPDLAEAMARLLDAPERLRPVEAVGFEGFWDPDGTVMPDTIRAAAGSDGIPERGFPWWLMHLAAPFGGFAREAAGVAPFWRHPVRLDNGRLKALLGREPRTPLAQAVRSTLIGLGCLPAPAVTPQERLASTSPLLASLAQARPHASAQRWETD